MILQNLIGDPSSFVKSGEDFVLLARDVLDFLPPAESLN
jgi:hypothetical protein